MRKVIGWLRWRSLPKKPSPAMVVALLALFVALSGVAVATIPDSNGTVTICYNSKDGTPRVVDTEAEPQCRKNETKLGLASVDSQGKVANSDRLDGLDSSQLLKNDSIHTYLVGSKPVQQNSLVRADCPDSDDKALSGGYAFAGSRPRPDDAVWFEGVFPTNNAYTVGFVRLDNNTSPDTILFDVHLFVTCADVDGDGEDATD
jgi:hypothetical protein